MAFADAHPRRWPFVFGIFAAIQFFILTTLAMLIFPGGSMAGLDDSGYSFLTTFFSELGMFTTAGGRHNPAGAVLFAVALTVGGAGLIAYSLYAPRLFREKRGVHIWTTVGSAFGVIAGLSFIGIAACPMEIAMRPHCRFEAGAFGGLLFLVICYAIAIFADRHYPDFYGRIYGFLAAILTGYICLLIWGPGYNTRDGIAVQATAQKIIAYAIIAVSLAQCWGAWRYASTPRQARVEKPVLAKPLWRILLSRFLSIPTWRRLLLVTLCAFPLAVALVQTTFCILVRKGLSTSNEAYFATWKSRALSVPDDYPDLHSFTPATIKAAREFRALWDQHTTAVLDVCQLHNEHMRNSPKWRQARPHLGQTLYPFRPLMAAFRELLTRPDFEVDALAAGISLPDYPYPSYPVPNLLSYQVASKLLCLNTLSLLDQNKIPEAMTEAEAVIRAARADRFSSLVSRLLTISVEVRGTQNWYDVVKACNDPALLRRMLKRQQELAPATNLILNGTHLTDEFFVTEARELMRHGIRVEIEGRTRWQMCYQIMRANAEYERLYVIPYLDRPAKQSYQFASSFPNPRQLPSEWFAPSLRNLLRELVYYYPARENLAVDVYNQNCPNLAEARMRDLNMQTRFSLLRLETAARLYSLEHNGQSPGLKDLIPEYVPAPKDPLKDFRDIRKRPTKPVIFSTNGRQFYLPGPDNADRKGALQYDPTNGAFSDGDFMLAR